MTSPGCHSVKVISTPVCSSIVVMERDLLCHLTDNLIGAWQFMPCSSRIISEMLPENHTIEKRDFLKPIIHSLII